MPKAKILAFAGSARKDSFNKQLVRFAATRITQAGGQVELIDLADFPMPLYHGDLEATDGIPHNATRLKQLFLANDGLLISCPEYNSSITPLLKNTIDWISRPVPSEPPLAAFRGKVAGLLSASPGQLGGLRGLVHVRAILSNIGVLVLPQQVAVPRAADKLRDGTLSDETLTAAVQEVCTRLVDTAGKLAG